MRLRVGWVPHASAIALGLVIVFFLTPLLQAEGAAWAKGLGILVAVYTLLGLAWGVTSPDKGWRWGLWLTSPLWLLILLSVLLAGMFYVFFTRDLPVLLSVTAAACGGAHLGRRLTRRPRNQ